MCENGDGGCETPLPAVLGLPPQAVPSLRPLPAALIRKRTSQLLRMGAHARNRSLIPAVWFTPERNQKPEMSSAGRPAHSPRAFQAGQSRGSGRHTVRPGMSLHTMESSFLHTAADCTQCQHKCRKKCCAQSAWRERRSISCDGSRGHGLLHQAAPLKLKHTPSTGHCPAAYHNAVRDKVRRSVCRPELSGFRDCAVSAAPGIIKRTPVFRESFFTG